MTERRESPERLFQQLDNLIAEIIDQFATQGHGTAVVIEALRDVLAKQQLAYERDPDPAEEIVEEPATDWPGADIRSEAKE